eukprot:g19566.t1
MAEGVVAQLVERRSELVLKPSTHNAQKLSETQIHDLLLSQLSQDPGLFLEKYGELLHEFDFFYAYQDNYAVAHYLGCYDKSKKPTGREGQRAKEKQAALAKNRRYRYMQKMLEEGSTFFSLSEMASRQPELYHQYIGQHRASSQPIRPVLEQKLHTPLSRQPGHPLATAYGSSAIPPSTSHPVSDLSRPSPSSAHGNGHGPSPSPLLCALRDGPSGPAAGPAHKTHLWGALQDGPDQPETTGRTEPLPFYGTMGQSAGQQQATPAPLSLEDIHTIKLSDLILRNHDNKRRIQENAATRAYFISPREDDREDNSRQDDRQDGDRQHDNGAPPTGALAADEMEFEENDETGTTGQVSQPGRRDIFGTPKLSVQRQKQLEEDFLRVMQERFLLGLEDAHFDYHGIDADSANDDFLQLERDMQEKYFDESDSD